MKGISQLMLITACMLTGTVYTMEIELVQAEVHHAATVEMQRAELVQGTLVKSPSIGDLNALTEQAQPDNNIHAGLASLAAAVEKATNELISGQETPQAEVTITEEEEESSAEQNPMTASLALSQEVSDALHKAKTIAEQSTKEREAARTKLLSALTTNGDRRGDLLRAKSNLEMNTQTDLTILDKLIKGLPTMVNKDSISDDVATPINTKITTLVTSLVTLAQTNAKIEEKIAENETLKKQLTDLDQVQLSSVAQTSVVQKEEKKSGWFFGLWS